MCNVLKSLLLALVALPSGTCVGAVSDQQPGMLGQSGCSGLQAEAQALAAWDRVRGWRIEYDVIPLVAESGSFPVHKIMAVSSPADIYAMVAHARQGIPWREDPFAQEICVHDGMIYHQWPFSRIYSESAINVGDMVPGSIPQDALLLVMPTWPVSRYKIPLGGEGFRVLPCDALRSQQYRVSPQLVRSSGELCWLVALNDVDRIWIAADKSLCVMKREFRDSKHKRLLMRVITDRTTLVETNLWLPTEYRVQFFAGAKDGKEDTLQRENKVHILRWDFAASGSDLSTPKHPPGTLRHESSGEFTQVMPGGEDLLDNYVYFMVKYAHLPKKSTLRERYYFWFLVGCTAGLCSGLLLFPTRSRRSRGAQWIALG